MTRAYDRPMRTTERVTVTVPRELVQHARLAVESGRAESVSAYVTEAMERAARRDRDATVLADIYARSGPPTARDYAWAADVLGVQLAEGEADDLARRAAVLANTRRAEGGTPA
jgi:Arc/MetJ-type ribon-helix-helix transcriptional regulator